MLAAQQVGLGAHQDGDQGEHQKSEGHQNQGGEHGGVNGGRAEFHNAGGLVEGVPPFHGEVDDGDVDDSDEQEDGAGLFGGAAVGQRGVQSDEAEIEEEED